MEELLALLRGGMPSSATTTPSLFQRSLEPVMQGRPQYLPELEVTAPAPTPTVAGALRRAQMVDEEASRNPEAARLREEELRQAMARLETLKGSVSDAALSPLLFALGGGATAGQLAENVGSLTGLESVERAGRAVREGAQESLDIMGSTGAANVPYIAGALAANLGPYMAAARIAPWQAAGGLAAIAGRALTSAPVDVVQAAQQEGSTAQMLAKATPYIAPALSQMFERASESLPGRFAVEALTNVLPDVAMEYALPAIRRGAQAAADVNTDILASRRGAIDLGGGADEAVPPRVPEEAVAGAEVTPEGIVAPEVPPAPDIEAASRAAMGGGAPPEPPRTPPAAPPSPEVMPPQPSGRYDNLIGRFDFSDPEGIDELKRVVARIEADPEFQAANKVETWKDVEALAERVNLPIDLEDISIEKAKRLSNAEMEAIGAQTTRNQNRIAEISQILKKQDTLNPLTDIDPATGQPYVALTEAEIDVLRAEEAALSGQLFAATERLAASTSERGRQLNFLKKQFKSIDDPTYWARLVLRELGPDRVRDLGPDFQTEVARAINAKNPEALYELVDKARRTPINEVLSRLYQSQLLSKPATLLVQVASIPRLAVEGLSSPVAALINRSIAESITAGGAGPILTGWSARKAKAAITGGQKGVVRAGRILRGKQSPEDIAAFRYGSTRSGIGVVDKYINAIASGQRAPDQVYTTMAHDLSIIGQAESIAKYENPTLSGAELDAKIQELVDKPTVNMLAQAVADAQRAVYANPTQLGNVAKAVQRLALRGPGETLNVPVGVTQLPFTRVPFGMAELTYEMSPLGLGVSLLEAGAAGARKLIAGGRVLAGAGKRRPARGVDFVEGVREAASGAAPVTTKANATTVTSRNDGTPVFRNKKLASDVLRAMKAAGVDAKAAQRISRGIAVGLTGAALYKLGVYLDEQGMMTPTLSDEDRALRSVLGMGQIPEGALVAGNRYWDIAYAGGPVWASILAGASYNQELRKMRERGEDVGQVGLFSMPGVKAAIGAAGSALKGLAQNPLFESQRRAQEVLEDPTQELPKYLQDLALNLTIPAAVSATARGMDPTIAQPTTLMERAKARLPVLSEEVPNRLTPLGEPQERLFPGIINQLVTPLRSMPVTYQNDAVIREFVRTGAKITPPRQGDTETDEQYRSRLQAEGPMIRGQLIDLISGQDRVKGDEYVRASKSEKAALLEYVVSRARTELTRARNAEAAQQAADAYNSANVGVQLRPDIPRSGLPPVPRSEMPSYGADGLPEVPRSPLPAIP